MNELVNKIEAILFYKGEEISLDFLSKKIGVKKSEIKEALENLKQKLKDSAFSIIQNENKVVLVVSSNYANLIAEIKESEKTGELSPAALETLSIILYKGPITKIELDAIRGINSVHSLRNLLVRGLIEKNKKGENIVYQESLDLLRYLGIEKKEDLPAFEKVKNKLEEIENNYLEDNSKIKKEENKND